MSTAPQSRKPPRPPAELCEIAALGDAAKKLLQPDMKPEQFVEALVSGEEYADAVRFLAHSLPKRECVWWAWVCARRAAGQTPPPVIKDALEATEKWIARPTDENRRAAMKAAEAAEFSSAAGCAGLGAFFSGGSVAPPEAPAVEPGEFTTAKAVAGAVIFAAVAGEPQKAPEAYRNFIVQGLEVAHKIKLWEATA